MSEDEKRRFEARLLLTKSIGRTRANEQARIGDRIEQLLYEAKTQEACEVLVALAYHVFDGGKL